MRIDSLSFKAHFIISKEKNGDSRSLSNLIKYFFIQFVQLRSFSVYPMGSDFPILSQLKKKHSV